MKGSMRVFLHVLCAVLCLFVLHQAYASTVTYTYDNAGRLIKVDYGNGKTGYIYATTAEAPGMEQLAVCGDKGTLTAQDGKLRFARLAAPLRKHLLTARAGFGMPKCVWKDVAVPKTDSRHIAITRAFVGHILRGTPMAATGREGLNELELSNAIYISGYLNKFVDLPVDAAEMERLLNRLVRTHGTGKGGNLRRRGNAELKRLLGKFPA